MTLTELLSFANYGLVLLYGVFLSVWFSGGFHSKRDWAVLFILYAQFSGLTTYASLSGGEMALLVLSGIVTSVPLILFAGGIKGTSMTVSGILMYVNPTLQLLLGVFA